MPCCCCPFVASCVAVLSPRSLERALQSVSRTNTSVARFSDTYRNSSIIPSAGAKMPLNQNGERGTERGATGMRGDAVGPFYAPESRGINSTSARVTTGQHYRRATCEGFFALIPCVDACEAVQKYWPHLRAASRYMQALRSQLTVFTMGPQTCFTPRAPLPLRVKERAFNPAELLAHARLNASEVQHVLGWCKHKSNIGVIKPAYERVADVVRLALTSPSPSATGSRTRTSIYFPFSCAVAARPSTCASPSYRG